MTRAELERVLARLYGDADWPRPLHLLRGLAAISTGTDIAGTARAIGTTAARLTALSEADDPISELLGERSIEHDKIAARVRAIIGQLIIGNLAERVFEDLYRQTVGSTDLQLRDERSRGGDTDYLVFNGQGRQVFRLNIKFHGSQFRRAQELVGLPPDDCFALATYKIYSALQKQEKEHLPYIFVIVGVPNLTGAVVGDTLPNDVIEFATRARTSQRFPKNEKSKTQ